MAGQFQGVPGPSQDDFNNLADQIVTLEGSGFGTPVDISGYNTADNLYTCPSDGYLECYGSASQPSTAFVYGKSGTTYMNIDTGASAIAFAIFMKKGMRIWAYHKGTQIRFIPLT